MSVTVDEIIQANQQAAISARASTNEFGERIELSSPRFGDKGLLADVNNLRVSIIFKELCDFLNDAEDMRQRQGDRGPQGAQVRRKRWEAQALACQSRTPVRMKRRIPSSS